MSDLSEFEEKYFIDGQRYNCPFCNVRGAKYTVVDDAEYNKNDSEIIYCYIVECDLCNKRSIHLSTWRWSTGSTRGRLTNPFAYRPEGLSYEKHKDYKKVEPRLDLFFFYHFPTGFFTINELIPKKIRELVSEADGCKEMNFMTGASGSLRRAIYKFLRKEGAQGKHYEDKIKWLKQKYTGVDEEYFDALANIKDMSDDDLHEEDWEPWKSSEFNYLVSCFKEVLEEIYVKPYKRSKTLSRIIAMKSGRKKMKE